jgi:hypothetical protein
MLQIEYLLLRELDGSWPPSRSSPGNTRRLLSTRVLVSARINAAACK